MVYERLYGPLGQSRDDQLTALIAAAISNAFASKAIPVGDFIPKWERVSNGDGT